MNAFCWNGNLPWDTRVTDWQHFEKGQAVNLGHNIDALFNAFHRETLSFLLPYYTGFDSESWLYSQHIINHMTGCSTTPYRIQYNLVTTANARRKGYAQRKKYWNIPTTFLAGRAQIRSPQGPEYDFPQHTDTRTGPAPQKGSFLPVIAVMD